MPQNQTQQPANKFHSLLIERDLKYTYERKCIFEEVSKLSEHFDADSLYERFKSQGMRISRDTVYRTIPLLLESGVIQKSVGDGKRDFYEKIGSKGHHDHMVCSQCGSFIEFHCEEIEKLQDDLCKKHGFRLLFHDHRLFGICKKCQTK